MVKDLKFRYPNHKNYVLKGIDLYVRAGERVCIAGPGGSGKTTLVNILSGIYTNYEGIVALNNYSLRDLDLTHLRNKIGKTFLRKTSLTAPFWKISRSGKLPNRCRMQLRP